MNLRETAFNLLVSVAAFTFALSVFAAVMAMVAGDDWSPVRRIGWSVSPILIMFGIVFAGKRHRTGNDGVALPLLILLGAPVLYLFTALLGQWAA